MAVWTGIKRVIAVPSQPFLDDHLYTSSHSICSLSVRDALAYFVNL